MILEDVKLNDVSKNEDESPYYFRSRSLDIITNEGTFTTPSRVNTRTEYVARSSVPLSEALDLNLAADFRELTIDQTTHVLSDNGQDDIKKILDLAGQFNDITRRAIFKISFFQPPQISLLKMTDDEKIDFGDYQADFFQKSLGAGIITYPYLALPMSKYKKFIDARNKRDENTTSVFTFDMSMETKYFREIINYVIDKKQPTIICLIHRPWMDTPKNHTMISKLYDNEKTAFFACQVAREEETSHGSNLHSIGFTRGFDLVALHQSRGGGGDKDLSLNKIKFFDPETLEINTIDNVMRNPIRDVVKEFNFAQHNFRDKEYVSMILNGYEGAQYHYKKHEILYYLARTHEAMLSPKIFAQTRAKIASNEMESYIKDTVLKNMPMLTTPLAE